MSAECYVYQSLGGAGLCFVEAGMAIQLRPDLFPSANNAGSAMPEAKTLCRRQGAKPYAVAFENGAKVECWAMSPLQLAQRIEWLTGLEVAEAVPIINVPDEPAMQPSPYATEQANRQKERAAEMKKLAAMDLPKHECDLQRQILSARRELGIM